MAIWAILGNIVSGLLGSALQDDASRTAVSGLQAAISSNISKTPKVQKQIGKQNKFVLDTLKDSTVNNVNKS